MNALVLMTLTLLTQAPNEADPGSYRPATTAAEAVKRIESRGGAVRKVARKGDALEVDFQFSDPTLQNQHLQDLRVLDRLVVLRLKNTQITDAGLAHLAGLTDLRRLHLDHTRITDSGLKHLSRLKQLEYLNLNDTRVGDTGLKTVGQLPKLKQLYVWRTRVAGPAIAADDEAGAESDLTLTRRQRFTQRGLPRLSDFRSQPGPEGRRFVTHRGRRVAVDVGGAGLNPDRRDAAVPTLDLPARRSQNAGRLDARAKDLVAVVRRLDAVHRPAGEINQAVRTVQDIGPITKGSTVPLRVRGTV